MGQVLQENDAQTAEQHSRESVRVARCTREKLGRWDVFGVNVLLGS